MSILQSPTPRAFPSNLTLSKFSLFQLSESGDIRTTNVMVKKTGEPGIILLDFDWAGMNVNT